MYSKTGDLTAFEQQSNENIQIVNTTTNVIANLIASALLACAITFRILFNAMRKAL